MAQIRTTIELLTKVLNDNGTSKVKAEVFRLSKFDHEDAVVPLWKLLFELVYYCEYGKIDDTSVRALNQFSTAEKVVYVKRHLQTRGFYSKDFAALPNDMSHGSREILLALGWLMCKENIIARFIKSRTSPLDDDTTGLLTEQLSTPPSQKESSSPGKTDIYSKVNQLLWLNNKLSLNLRSLFALQREKNILKHRIHEATYGSVTSADRNHLSQMEVYMLRHPELLKTNLDLLEKDNERLQNLLKWKDHEDIFWRWMGSVLDAKLNNKQLEQNPAAGDAEGAEAEARTTGMSALGDGDNGTAALAEVESNVFARLQQTHMSLQDAILKYESIVDQLESNWETKTTSVSDAELDNVLSSIDLELSIQKVNIALNNCESYLKNQTPERQVPASQSSQLSPSPSQNREPQFILEKKSQVKPVTSRMRPTDVRDSNRTDSIKDIEQEIKSLYGMVDMMQREVEDKQNSFKEEMQTLSTKFQDAICISPMARKF